MSAPFLLRRTPVPSGNYVVSNNKNEVLDAYLGTCVGITLVDEKKNMGGLMHILLPEPTGMSILGKMENYAKTGLPVFINALRSELGDKGDFVATIAGGALVGPVSDLDLNLDIGGRTVEIVENILKSENIPVVKSETGGHFCCRLSLNLSTWESSIKPISVPEETDIESLEMPSMEQLESAISGIKPIPQIALKLMRMIRNDYYGMDDLGIEIKQDQIISARIIRLCNSAYFKQNNEVDSIERALVVLGEKRLLQMVVSASMEGFFNNDSGGYSLCKGGLFKHAVGTALICEKLASCNKEISSDIAYTAGLLHDIGKIALDQFLDRVYPLFYRRTQERNETLVNVEKEVFGLTHTEAGGKLAEMWGLPERLIDVIRYHHNPEEAEHDNDLNYLVYLADLLMSRFIVGQELDRINTDSFYERLGRVGIKADQFSKVVEELSDIFSNLSV
ncbi:MAG: HDOD domain-containing protein [Desulfobacteraceae bacterium]|jgi:putative nucleotidyltransferase with HDIG domain